jgi:hypothetical protein
MKPRPFLIFVAPLLLVAACGGGASDDEGVLSLEGDAESATSSTRIAGDEAVLEVTRCLRDRGYDIPDIGITADGQLDLAPEDLTGIDLESSDFYDAFAECLIVFQDSTGLDVTLDPELEAAFLDQLRDFSQCMRDNGITDFPDPMPGLATAFPFTAWTDFDEPEFQEALGACREIISFGGILE